jgi:acylphosphatase
MSVRKRALVSGRVQGVFYRDTCRRVARAHGVAGIARNLDDGRVEVILEGDEAAVEEVLSWCREGTPQAQVDAVEVTGEPPEGLTGFDIS